MELRERVARKIALVRTGFDPDVLVYTAALQMTPDGHKIVPSDMCFSELWKTYLDAADAAIGAIDEQYELEGRCFATCEAY